MNEFSEKAQKSLLKRIVEWMVIARLSGVEGDRLGRKKRAAKKAAL
jgi:hypothetical protein